MRDISISLQQSISKQLNLDGFDVIDLLPIPKRGDKLVRIKSIEEMIEEFESNHSDVSYTYLVQIRHKPLSGGAPNQKEDSPTLHTPVNRPRLDGVFLPNGKLNVNFLLKNAEILFKGGEYALARNIYKNILRTGECTSTALYWLGRTFESEEKLEESIPYYEDSLAYLPSLETYQRLSSVLIHLMKYQEAAELLEKALHLKEIQKSGKFEIHKKIGQCWLNSRAPEKAEDHFKKALHVEPMADDVLVTLGSLYLQKSKTEESKRRYEDALTINSKNEHAHLGLGTCLYMEGDKSQAHDHFVKSLEINLNNATAIFYLVRCAYELKSYSAATRLVAEYVKTAPVNASLLYSLAGLQFHFGKLGESQQTLQNLLQLSPNHTGAMDLMKLIDRYSKIRP